MRGILFIGPPGSGKITAARKMARGLPPLYGQTAIETAWIYFGARLIDASVFKVEVPFRAPHYSVSEAGLIGSCPSQKRIYPGEASLANGGCLVLDELSEFRRSSIEALGRVLRAGESIMRNSDGSLTGIPAKPELLCATANLCPCGYLGSTHPCKCDDKSVARLNARIVEYCEMLGITEIISCGYSDVRTQMAAAVIAAEEQKLRSMANIGDRR